VWGLGLVRDDHVVMRGGGRGLFAARVFAAGERIVRYCGVAKARGGPPPVDFKGPFQIPFAF
jgi:hypothetical protein